MTKSNETSQVETAGAKRRGNLALWISLASGAAAVAILMLVMISVYNADRTYSTGVHTIAGLEAEIKRLTEDRQAAEMAMVEARKASEAAISEARAASEAAISEARAASEAAIAEARMASEASIADVRTASEAAIAANREDAEAAIADSRKRINEARDRMAAAEEEASQLLDQVENGRAELTRISADLQATKNALGEQQALIKAAEEQQSKLATDMKSQEETLTNLKIRVAADTAKADQLKRELTALEGRRKEFDSLQTQISERRDVLADMAIRESNAKEGLALAKAMVENAKSEQGEQEKLLNGVREQLSVVRREQDAAEAKRALYASEVAELTVSRDTLQRQVAELQRRFDGLEAQIAQAREIAEPSVE